MFYYSVISPGARIYRLSNSKTPYVKLTGWRRFKEARGGFGHKLHVVWKDVRPKVRGLLKTHKILTSVAMKTRTSARRSMVRWSSGWVFFPLRSMARMPSDQAISLAGLLLLMSRSTSGSPSSSGRPVQRSLRLFSTSTPLRTFADRFLLLSGSQDEYVPAHDTSRRHVVLLGTDVFNDLLASIKICIDRYAFTHERDDGRGG